MKKSILSSLVAVPVAAAAVLSFAGSAAAAALTGEFQFSSGFTSEVSTVSFKKDALYFSPDPASIFITSQTDSFSAFNFGKIDNIISFAGDIADNPFLDLGDTTAGVASITDNKSTFTLEETGYKLTQSGGNVAIDTHFFGFFTSETGETSKGAGNLTFQINNTTVADVEAILNSGGTIKGLTFSGGAFTASVPEPTTLLGLGAVAAAMATSGLRKKDEAEA